MDWKDMLEWAKGLTGLVMMVILAVLGGKTWRANRIDSARTNAAVAEWEGEAQQAKSNSSALARMETALDEQTKKIDALTDKVTALEAEVHRLNSGRNSALDLLEEIELCEVCEDKNGILLRTAIKALKGAHDVTHGK